MDRAIAQRKDLIKNNETTIINLKDQLQRLKTSKEDAEEKSKKIE